MNEVVLNIEKLSSINGGGVAYDMGKAFGKVIYYVGEESYEIGKYIYENIRKPLENKITSILFIDDAKHEALIKTVSIILGF
ncbi:hypothetical protein Calkr_1956 [Caldicellulosiruptor acetigenus I77R1B]|uniref:Uncharacterized protein n=2 Tax=Caldicellulosiruptor acetigenus TaxID=301953 RepID=G2PXP5_9FIRM|nr:hypothetical protein [Caldicellulosiruptor acetigenus]ADQ41434.1 hypothetical protein Calkr_1956 [Caldicellulosiruptor acetigenus I77R1B]AEM73065.1 hypothetical protein Calla_0404 [Caldicellulosiruptor acetigenus 6A]